MAHLAHLDKVDFFIGDDGQVHPVRGSGADEGERKSKEPYKPKKVGEKRRYAKIQKLLSLVRKYRREE